MEAPGLSLFQGSDSIQLNASAQRQEVEEEEEEEEREDLKRRNEEIKDLLTNAFDDLENDDDDDDDDEDNDNVNHHDSDRDIRSINSSRYFNASRNNDVSNATTDSSFRPNLSRRDNDPTILRLRGEFGTYDRAGETNNYNDDSDTFRRGQSEGGRVVSEVQREFGAYIETPTTRAESAKLANADITSESPYKLSKPPLAEYARNSRARIGEGYALRENYPYDYDTPASRYDRRIEYANNGYAGGCEDDVRIEPSHEFGGGDNDARSEHFDHCYKISQNGRQTDNDTAYKTTEFGSKEQLEVLYSVRMREIQKLTEELQRLQLDREEEKKQLGRKLALAQAELERSNLSRNQAQNSLVDAKAEVADLQSQVTALKDNVSVLEKTNRNMTQELSNARDTVVDLQQKIAVLERVQSLQAGDKTHEKFLKQAQEKHSIEMRNMQTQIDVLTDKLSVKESSCTALEDKLIDVRRAHEILMMEKGDTINSFARALEESQAQCRNLMTSTNVQEVMQLQAVVKVAAQEKEELLKTVRDLQYKLELAKGDSTHCDSALTATLEEESDSIRQMKLGEIANKSRKKPNDDIANKLRGELQRCLTGQAVKRKEIIRLESTLSQKEKDLDKALSLAETCRREAARYAKRVDELERQLESLSTDKAIEANARIQKLSDHLNDAKQQCDALTAEKLRLERRLAETLAISEETLKKSHQETTLARKGKDAVEEYNKEYLEIHDKAVERIRQEAHIEIVQLSVQLEQTQKELDRVKELYIDVCGTKEQLIAEHNNEIETLKKTYGDLEARKRDSEKSRKDFEAQIRVTERLTKQCEVYSDKIIELEKDLCHERRKRDEYTKKIHTEIERVKDEALKELRHAHPDRHISVNLPDHCSEHLNKITQLEDDCKRLEEKLSVAVGEREKVSSLQTELDDAKLKIAQMEIIHESTKKRYDDVVNERNDLAARASKLEGELSGLKKGFKLEGSDDAKLRIGRVQMDYDSLRDRLDGALRDRDACKEKVSRLEVELSDARRTASGLEGKLRRSSSEVLLISRKTSELDEELCRYKDMVAELTSRLNELTERRRTDGNLEEKLKQLETELAERDEKLQGLKDLERIREERDQLVTKLKNQAKQFERYVNSQKQVSAELNSSPRGSGDGADLRKMKEIVVKEVREEMEQKVAKELRDIGERYCEERKQLEERYERRLRDLQARYDEKTKEVEIVRQVMITEKAKLHSSLKAQEQAIDAKVQALRNELLARKIRIEQLEVELKRRDDGAEEERNVMAQVMSEWAAEIEEIKARETKVNEEIRTLKVSEESLTTEIKELKEKEKQMIATVNMLKDKHQSAKKTAQNYKEHANEKEKFLLNECKRIEEGYKRAMNQVQQKVDAIVSKQEEQVATKLKQIESQYDERLEQMRLNLKYKSKC